MIELKRVNAPPTLFEEARQIISEWEKENLSATRIVMVLSHEGEDFVQMSHTGKARAAEIAGLFLMGAQLAVEE